MIATPSSTTATSPRTLSLDVIGASQILTIRQRLSSKREEIDTYLVAEIGSEIGGRGFELAKVTPNDDGDVYHVLVNGPKAGECDCKGYVRHGHCKHSAALLKLIELGRLAKAA